MIKQKEMLQIKQSLILRESNSTVNVQLIKVRKPPLCLTYSEPQ